VLHFAARASLARRLAASLAVGAALLLTLVSPGAGAQERVTVDSLDPSVRLIGFWFPAPVAALPTAAPAVVLLHGCGGPYGRFGQLSERMREYAQLLNAHGIHALVLDSLTPRSQRELCTQRIGQRSVTQTNRRLDALAAVAWLAQREGVDARRIGLLGWSNGGSTVLASINSRHPAVAQAPQAPAFAVAFYPGCEAELRRGFATDVPLLMLVGEADDWTPAAPCHALTRAADGRAPQIEGYEGAYHGFDSGAAIRLRMDVPNGVHPGQGVHVGGDARARAASRERLLQFLADPLRQ
jgi:dienelactone hydrolase